MTPTTIELHLNATPLTRAESKAIKAAGGAFSICRGYASTRYVTLSLDCKALIDRLTLTPERLEGVAADVDKVVTLPDPVGETLGEVTRPNGLKVSRRRFRRLSIARSL